MAKFDAKTGIALAGVIMALAVHGVGIVWYLSTTLTAMEYRIGENGKDIARNTRGIASADVRLQVLADRQTQKFENLARVETKLEGMQNTLQKIEVILDRRTSRQ